MVNKLAPQRICTNKHVSDFTVNIIVIKLTAVIVINFKSGSETQTKHTKHKNTKHRRNTAIKCSVVMLFVQLNAKIDHVRAKLYDCYNHSIVADKYNCICHNYSPIILVIVYITSSSRKLCTLPL